MSVHEKSTQSINLHLKDKDGNTHSGKNVNYESGIACSPFFHFYMSLVKSKTFTETSLYSFLNNNTVQT